MESKQVKEASSVTPSQPASGLDVESQPLRDALRPAPDTIDNSDSKLRQVIDTIPALAWCNLADGPNEFLNKRWHDYTGLSEEESHGWGWQAAFHPEDLPSLMEKWRAMLASGEPGEIEARLRRRDGVYRWFLIRAEPFRDETGQLVRWYGTSIDIEDRKQAEQKLLAEIAERERAEESLKLQVDILQHLPAISWTALPNGMLDFASHQWREYTGQTLDDARSSPEAWMTALHPDDRERARANYWEGLRSGQGFTFEARVRRASDGAYRWHLKRAVPVSDSSGNLLRLVGTSIDIEDLKLAEQSQRESERSFRLIVDGIAGLAATMTSEGAVELVNRRVLEYFGKTLEDLKGWTTSDAVHPSDLPRAVAAWRRSVDTGDPYDVDHRLRRADGVYRWFHSRGLALRDPEGRIVRWYNLLTDIEDRKSIEDQLRRSERFLLEAQRLGRTGSWSLDAASGMATISPEALRLFDAGRNNDHASLDYCFSRIHADDRRRVRELFEKCVAEKRDYTADYRIVLRDGTVRYQHSVGYPVLGESGQLVEFLGVVIDTTEHVEAHQKLERAFAQIKLLKDQLQKENLALREEVDRVSMFEEIVGSSPSLQGVLSRVTKVAPTDSSVLITGETGTGKELIARAVHKRSRRAGGVFVSVNCAALPPTLISSELFGHEKGAFTGAMRRRLGRFELADRGTIFLDEVVELLPDTQAALLRVLQEREFERVGGGQPIRVDVRVIAATNRDLNAAVADGSFRQDLFYRLNVFPIAVPPLRERKGDILVLVEYFVQRYASKAGKNIRSIDKKTLDALQSYDWPGNIRELQNVIERSVILTYGDILSVDESWLSKETSRRQPPIEPKGTSGPMSEPPTEREIIEKALAETRGRVSGPSGAAAKLGIPASTLSSRIKALKIDRSQFKFLS
jgi:PAS domain S-box-containing protein